MKAISLWQPWASLMAYGEKTIETRSWSTTHRGPLAIHAAKRLTREIKRIAYSEPFASTLRAHGGILECVDGRKRFEILAVPFGRVVAIVDLIAVVPIEEVPSKLALPKHERYFGDYTPGRFAWITENPRRLTRDEAAEINAAVDALDFRDKADA